MKNAAIAPAVNQIRLCSSYTQMDYCCSQNILLEVDSLHCSGKISNVLQMQSLAKKHWKSITQICIRWSLQQGYQHLPK
jgi:diketogulonate reductase-like aldo/keto reductase